MRADRGQEVDWNGALALVELAVRAPDVPRPAGAGGDNHDWDPDWRSSRRDAAGILEQAMSRRLLPIELADRVWHALEALSWDPNPTPNTRSATAAPTWIRLLSRSTRCEERQCTRSFNMRPGGSSRRKSLI